MKLGFSPIQGDGHHEGTIEEVEFAEANGLDSGFLREHHEATVDQYWSDPVSVLTGIAARTDSIGLGTAILLLPLYNPVRLAERGAILDGLSGAGSCWGPRWATGPASSNCSPSTGPSGGRSTRSTSN